MKAAEGFPGRALLAEHLAQAPGSCTTSAFRAPAMWGGVGDERGAASPCTAGEGH